MMLTKCSTATSVNVKRLIAGDTFSPGSSANAARARRSVIAQSRRQPSSPPAVVAVQLNQVVTMPGRRSDGARSANNSAATTPVPRKTKTANMTGIWSARRPAAFVLPGTISGYLRRPSRDLPRRVTTGVSGHGSRQAGAGGSLVPPFMITLAHDAECAATTHGMTRCTRRHTQLTKALTSISTAKVVMTTSVVTLQCRSVSWDCSTIRRNIGHRLVAEGDALTELASWGKTAVADAANVRDQMTRAPTRRGFAENRRDDAAQSPRCNAHFSTGSRSKCLYHHRASVARSSSSVVA